MTDDRQHILLTLVQVPLRDGDEEIVGYRVESPALEKAVGGETVPDALRNLAGLVEDDTIELTAPAEATD